MTQKTFLINSLENNPWHFRILQEKNFDSLVLHLEKEGVDAISPPTVAIIDKKKYIVDGHSRILAAREAGIKKVACLVANWIKDYKELRKWSFRLNNHGYSNPLTLSDMISEDIKLYENVETVAHEYGVSSDYVLNLKKVSTLHDDTKAIIQKLITVASKKYQHLLEQITPTHISSLAELEPKQQVEVVNWIFNDVIYGPPNESQVSVPSILEIVNEIKRINDSKTNRQKTTYKKNKSQKLSIPEIPFKCKCGLSYEIDLKSNKIFEYIEFQDMKVKKEFVSPESSTRTYSSSDYSAKDLTKIIHDNWKNAEIRIIVDEGNADEDWK